MPTFPTLSVQPSYAIDESKEDATIHSPFEGGYEQTRPRFTRKRKSFVLRYKYLPSADKSTLETFVDTVHGGADSFAWTNPITSVQHTVRFKEPPKFSKVSFLYWDIEFVLVEV